MMWWLLGIVLFAGLVLSTAAQTTDCISGIGGDYDAPAASCLEQGQVDISIAYPAWILDHPYILEDVKMHINQQRADFINAGLFYRPARNPFLEITYREFHHQDIVTLEFYTLADYGGLYPISSVQTFTYDQNTEARLTFADLFVDYDGAFAIIAPQVEEAVCFSCYGSEDAVVGAAYQDKTYKNFILTETELIVVFPPERIGAMNAGTLSVVLSLADLVPYTISQINAGRILD